MRMLNGKGRTWLGVMANGMGMENRDGRRAHPRRSPTGCAAEAAHHMNPCVACCALVRGGLAGPNKRHFPCQAISG